MTRSARLAAVAALMCGAVAGCGSGGGGGSSSAGTTSGVPGGASGTIPGQIDPHPQGFFSRDLLQPIVNAWRTSDGQRFTEVDAGALASDHSVGVLALYRGASAGSAQGATLKKVLGSGPLRIVGAPTGVAAETKGQRSGTIRFVGANGVRGTLRLSKNSIALQPPAGG